MRKHFRRLARNAAKDYGLGLRVPRAYRRAAAAPVDPRKVLFLESSLPGMPDAFKLLFERFDADPAFDATFVSLGKHRVGAAAYLRNCEAFAAEAATARIIYLCDASDVVSCLPLRPETRVVQLWHACGAFKRFGMSTASFGYGLSRADIERHPFYENLSLVTVSSPEVEWAYVEAMHLEGREGIVQALGVSRTDLLFDGAFHERAFRHLYEAVPAALGKRVVLYAPTYRGDLSDARAPEPPDFAGLKRALGADSVLLVKQHPMVRELPCIPDGCGDFAFEVTEAMPIDELLVVSDVLVTDYSSVVFEFSLFGRPMAFFAPDLDEYLADRNFYYGYDAMTPGPVVATSGELAACLAGFGESGGEEVKAFRAAFMGSCDGHATDRIFDFSVQPATGRPHMTARRPRGASPRRPHVVVARLAFNALYRAASRGRRRDEVVFVSRRRDEPSYDFSALAAELESRGWTATMHLKEVTRRNMAGYARHVLAEIRLLGRCRAVVLDRYDPVVSLIDFDCGPRPAAAAGGPANLDFPREPVVLQLWHAFGAFKKFGYQTAGTPEGHPSGFLADWRIHRNCSWVVCSGEGCRAAFAEAFSCPEERVVALNRPEYDELAALRPPCGPSAGAAPEPGGRARMRVLMAPTLRKDAASPHPFRDLYGRRAGFEAALDADVTWAFHPLEDGLPAPGNVSEGLLGCDVVVTDYSSRVYEAHLLGKKVLFYVPDIGSYRLSPGLNRDPLAEAPALCALGEGELLDMLQALVRDPGAYPQGQLRAFVGEAFDVPPSGTVASRLADFLIAQAAAR